MRVLVVDNYDSFVYNLVQYLAQLGAECVVWRNDAVDLDAIDEFDGVLVSPGPGTPERAGSSIDVIQQCADTGKPVLGVCLGHQAIGVVWGGDGRPRARAAARQDERVFHEARACSPACRSPFTATRYHSLTVLPETIPAEFEVTGGPSPAS